MTNRKRVTYWGLANQCVTLFLLVVTWFCWLNMLNLCLSSIVIGCICHCPTWPIYKVQIGGISVRAVFLHVSPIYTQIIGAQPQWPSGSWSTLLPRPACLSLVGWTALEKSLSLIIPKFLKFVHMWKKYFSTRLQHKKIKTMVLNTFWILCILLNLDTPSSVLIFRLLLFFSLSPF